MNSSELYELFRSEVADEAVPYLWTDAEVWRYMNDAYRQFVRLTGGVPDISSDITRVDIVAGELTAEVSRKILRIREARLESTDRKLKVVNYTDEAAANGDYDSLFKASDRLPGAVVAVVIGEQKGLVRWIQKPVEDDAALLSVYRLPLDEITGDGQEFTDVDEDDHESLLLWMKHRAYLKQDAETYDKWKSQDFRAQFEIYCDGAKKAWERLKHKTRVVSYGGL